MVKQHSRPSLVNPNRMVFNTHFEFKNGWKVSIFRPDDYPRDNHTVEVAVINGDGMFVSFLDGENVKQCVDADQLSKIMAWAADQ